MGTGKELRCAIMKREREKEKKGICGGMKAGIGAFFFSSITHVCICFTYVNVPSFVPMYLVPPKVGYGGSR